MMCDIDLIRNSGLSLGGIYMSDYEIITGSVSLAKRKPDSNAKNDTMQRFYNQYPFFCGSAIVYGIVFAACMYRNLHGLFSTILVYGTFVYAFLCIRRTSLRLEKKHIVYPVLGALLGFNLMFTMDPLLIFIDYVAILLVLFTGIFSVVGCTKQWDVEDFLSIVPRRIFGALLLTRIGRIITDRQFFVGEEDSRSRKRKAVMKGILLSLPLLFLVTALLQYADAVFGSMVSDILGGWDIGMLCGIVPTALVAIVFAYGSIRLFYQENVAVVPRDKRTKDPVILITIGIVLGIVYVIFCAIQVVYLFAGAGTLPEGYTYAQYAREGFFQLLAVCLINLVLILTGIHHFREDRVLKGIMTGLILCTYLMIASSAYRMILYVSAYNLTTLRVWVLWTLIWLTVILTGAFISVYCTRFSLFFYSMIVTSVLYLMIAYARPAYIVAEYNLKMYATNLGTVSIIDEVVSLNGDAAGPVAEYLEGEYSEHLSRFFSKKRPLESDGIRKFNLSEQTYREGAKNRRSR